jgi:hypothetical protein
MADCNADRAWKASPKQLFVLHPPAAISRCAPAFPSNT